ncbi:hypothetical protein ID866_7776 [Astraeus odoratus]|nr:hypothetical protein ID866_7776 [Astraeus odoratus]
MLWMSLLLVLKSRTSTMLLSCTLLGMGSKKMVMLIDLTLRSFVISTLVQMVSMRAPLQRLWR